MRVVSLSVRGVSLSSRVGVSGCEQLLRRPECGMRAQVYAMDGFDAEFGHLSEKKKAQAADRWRELLYNFTQDTTLHGIRYVTHRHEHWVRRITWVLVLVTAFGVFLGIIISNIVRWYGHPKTVNMDISYKDRLPFPAVTVCNHNMFRLTKSFEAGLYDFIQEKFKTEESGGLQHKPPAPGTERCEKFTNYGDWCPSERWTKIALSRLQQDPTVFIYSRVTLRGCERLCETVHDELCTSLLYSWLTKVCLITSKLPHDIKMDAEDAQSEKTPEGKAAATGSDPVEIVPDGSHPKNTVQNGSEPYETVLNGSKPKEAISDGSDPKKRVPGVPPLNKCEKEFQDDDNTKMGNEECLNKTSEDVVEVSQSCLDRAPTIQLFKRNRCLEVLTKITCDWESYGCPFQETMSADETFLVTTARGHIPLIDHTIQTLRGSYLMLIRTKRAAPLDEAAIITPYIRLHGHCAEFYYQQTGDAPVWLALHAITEDQQRFEVWPAGQGYRLAPSWHRVMVHLPDGVFRLELRTKRPAEVNVESGLAVDDLTVWPCDMYYRNCLRTRLGTEYHGPQVIAEAGERCISSCKNPDGDIRGPWCMVYTQDYNYQRTYCKIPFCACHEDQVKCGDESCIPQKLACDGHRDCVDGTDETTLCAGKRSVACEFDDVYNCGYTINGFWQRTSPVDSQSLGEKIDVDHSSSTLGYFMKFDTSRSQEGDRGFLHSVMYHEGEPACLSFFLYIPTFFDGHLRLLLQISRYYYLTLQDVVTVTSVGEWMQHNVALPPGEFVIVFEATAGTSFKSNLAIDDILVSAPEDCGMVAPNDQLQLLLDAQGSDGSCRFSPHDTCGYTNMSTSSKLSWELYPESRKSMLSGSSSGIFKVISVEGWLESPNYPDMYRSSENQEYFIFGDMDHPGKIHLTLYDLKARSCCDRLRFYGKDINRTLSGTIGNATSFTFNTTVLVIVFETKDDLYYLRFKAWYWIEYQDDTKFVLGLTTKDGVVSEFDQRITLTSPLVKLKNKACLVFNVTNFIPLSIVQYDVRHETRRVILEVPTTDWNRDVGLDLPAGEFYILFEGNVKLSGERKVLAVISDLRNYNTTCADRAIESSQNMSCNFRASMTCGYEDRSLSFRKWNVRASYEEHYLAMGYTPYLCHLRDPARTGPYYWNQPPPTPISGTPSPTYYSTPPPGTLPSDSPSPYYPTAPPGYSTSETIPSNHPLSQFPRTTPGNNMGSPMPGYSTTPTQQFTTFAPAYATTPFSGSTSYPSYNNSAKKEMDAIYVCHHMDSDPFSCRLQSPAFVLSEPACYKVQLTFYACPYVNGTLKFFSSNPLPSYLGQVNLLPSISRVWVQLNLEATTRVNLEMEASAADGTLVIHSVLMLPGECVYNESTQGVSKPSSERPTTRPWAPPTTPASNRDYLIDGNPSAKRTENATNSRSIADDTNQRQFVIAASHRLKDLIHSCKWFGQSCAEESFTKELTDMGMCYTFNARNETMLYSNITGSDYGLKLTINLETYERMAGPNSDIGVKLHLHNQTDLPLVSESGFAAPVGLHSLLLVKYTKVVSLGDPYGTCGSQTLDAFPYSVYSFPRCQAQCQTNAAAKACSCIAAQMPSYNGVPVCSMTDYTGCILKNSSATGSTTCPCKNACEAYSYDIQSSFSTIENVDFRMASTHLEEEYHEALETRHRANPVLFEATVSRFTAMLNAADFYLREAERQSSLTAYSHFKVASEALVQFRAKAEQDALSMLECLGQIEPAYTVIYGAKRQMLTTLLKEMSTYIGLAIQYGKRGGKDESVMNPLQQAAVRARDLLSKMIENEFKKLVKPLEKYGHQSQINLKAVPGVIHVKTVDEKGNKSSSANAHPNLLYNSSLILIQEMLKQDLSDWNIAELTHLFMEATAQIGLLTDHMMEFPSILRDIDKLQQETVLRLSDAYWKPAYNLNFNFEQASQKVKSHLANYTKVAKEFYSANKGKMDIAEFLTTERIKLWQKEIQDLQSGIENDLWDRLDTAAVGMETRAVTVYVDIMNVMSRLLPYYNKTRLDLENIARTMFVWKGPQFVEQSDPVLTHAYNDSKQMWPPRKDFRSFVDEGAAERSIKFILKDYFDPVRSTLDSVVTDLRLKIEEIERRASDIIADTSNFKKVSVIDSEFTRDNFLHVDIYFGELKMQVIEQKEAYTMTDFWSDLGGYLGLLLGASVVTICEFLDLVVFNALRMFKRKRKVDETPIMAISKAEKVAWGPV